MRTRKHRAHGRTKNHRAAFATKQTNRAMRVRGFRRSGVAISGGSDIPDNVLTWRGIPLTWRGEYLTWN